MTMVRSRSTGMRLAVLTVLAGLTLAITGTTAVGQGLAEDAGASTTEAARPLKVFILAGQSNMQGHARVRTIDSMALDPATAPLVRRMLDADGTPVVCRDVWISSIGSSDQERTGRLTAGYGASAGGPKIGPEFSFGITMSERLGEPILLIKTAWGGKSLHTDFRPPSAGPSTLSDDQLQVIERRGDDVEAARSERARASGRIYRQMIDHVRHVLADIGRVYPAYEPEQGFELAGFVWFQGWNDMVDGGAYPGRDRPGGYDAYSDLLAQLIRDVRTDLSAPSMPFVIGVMGVGGPVDEYPPEQQRYVAVHRNFRQAMAAPAARPEFAGNVAAVATEAFWDSEVVALRARDAEVESRSEEIREQIEQGDLGQAEGAAAIAELAREAFTARERVILRESTSNAEYHYLGSAKILARIGEAFAEAMVSMMDAVPTSPDQ